MAENGFSLNRIFSYKDRMNLRFCSYGWITGQRKPVFWHILCNGRLRNVFNVCNVFNTFFSKFASNLKFPKCKDPSLNCDDTGGPLWRTKRIISIPVLAKFFKIIAGQYFLKIFRETFQVWTVASWFIINFSS